MAGVTEKELEKRLLEAGKKFDNLPENKDELLSILEEVENCLSMVEQSPSEAMQLAVCPSMDALVRPELLRHQDKDVRLIVITCISEITRITAPEAPYSDDLMKEIFQLIVQSFQGLDEIKSPLFARRVTILETVAKVRSCVVMLDLECDELILEMFQHFFATASKNHSENVSTSMQTIMTLVLDESEDIPQTLLSVLLTTLRRDNWEVSPAAHELAIHVVTRCAEKLRPYLTSEMSAEGLAPSDLQKKYHEIVYDICQHAPHTSLPIVSNNAEHHLVDGTHAPTSVVGNEALTNAQDANLHPVHQLSVDGEDLMRNEDKHVSDHKDSKMNEDKQMLEGDENGDKDLPQKISDSSVKDEAKENVSQDMVSPAPNKASKGRRSVQSRRPTSTYKIESHKPPDSQGMESGKPTVRDKERRKSKKSEVLPEVTKGSDENIIGSDTQALSSSKRKRGRSGKDSKSLASLGHATKEIGGLQSPSHSNVEELGLASTAQLNEDTADLATSSAQPNEDMVGVSPAQSSKEAAVMTSPERSSKEAVGLACTSPLNKETCDLTSPGESSKVSDHLVTPPRSNKDTEGLSSPAQSTKDNIGSPSQAITTKEAVGLSSPARSSKETVGLAAPGVKQSLPEDDDTGADSSRTKRGRLRSSGKRSVIKEDSKLPGLTMAATERAADGVVGIDMTPTELPNTTEQLEASKNLETRSKRSKRKLDVSNSKSEDKISLRSQKDLKEMDTPDTIKEDGHRPKKMQKVASAPDLEEKTLSQASESLKRTPRNSAKKRSISGLEKTPTTVERNDEDEMMVGRKIKVWWPKDKQFYDGIVDAYDPKLKKHKVLYNDGDVEVLNLHRQKWEFVDDSSTTEKSSTLNSPKTAGDKTAKKRANQVEGSILEGETNESFAKRGTQSSKTKKDSRSQANVKPKDNGAMTKNASTGLSPGTLTVQVESKENIDQPTSGSSKGRQQKQGGENKKGRRVVAESTPTNGSAKSSKGIKTVADQDKTGISSDTGARSSDDEPLNAWRSRARTEH